MNTTIVYGPGGHDPGMPNNNIIEVIETPDIPTALDGIPLVATLNVVLGIWTLSDAARIAGTTEQALIDEATAWAVASEANNGHD